MNTNQVLINRLAVKNKQIMKNIILKLGFELVMQHYNLQM